MMVMVQSLISDPRASRHGQVRTQIVIVVIVKGVIFVIVTILVVLIVLIADATYFVTSVATLVRDAL